MEHFELISIFLFVLFLLLGTGVWVGFALMGVAIVGIELFTSRPAGDAMLTAIWASSTSVVADRTAAVYLDGRDTVSHKIVPGFV